MKLMWWVYMIVSRHAIYGNLKTYVGATNNLEKRVKQHNGQMKGGAKATRGEHYHWKVHKTFGPFEDRSAAFRFEHVFKKKTQAQRLKAS